jgi:hypothetical protein
MRREEVPPLWLPPQPADEEHRIDLRDRHELLAERTVRRDIVELVRRSWNVGPVVSRPSQSLVVSRQIEGLLLVSSHPRGSLNPGLVAVV